LTVDFEPPRPQRHALAEESLGWGIVGASSVAGQWMVDAIRSQQPLTISGRRLSATNSWIVGVYSHDENRARRFADLHQIPHAYVNLADLLAHPQIQCIYLSGYARHRAQAALAALAAGKHVLCEIPIALAARDALRMAHTALEHNLILAVNFRLRADPALRRLRDLLAERAIGDIAGGRISHTRLLPTSLQTWRLRPNGGGVVFDQTSHDIDLLRYFFRDEVSSVCAASTQRLLGDAVEEDVVAWVSLRRSGLTFQLHDSFHVPHHATSVEIYGSAGALSARHCFSHEHSSELLLYRYQREVALPLEPSKPFYHSVHAFNAAVRGEGAPLASAIDGIQSLIVALAIHESIQNGRRVQLDDLPRPVVDMSIT
jgi:1,5-anhydro-D-fructose reductase (1,5-anhydro-D-mannitol-forming)